MKTKMVLTMAGLLVAAALPMLAHHSFAAEFDDAKKVMLKGSVVKVEWQNPHIWLYVDVKDENGKDVALKDLRGKTVVLFFYPRASTPG